ncbi:hypothetical protein BU16DRAFT_538424 [Lophium mytilinum]|uniref:Uncharacterized protein n=1 Tax=Lophium mytilinum TaxID=390894 RepID=A0A6A6QUC4_9PEZI|nr:hypothetical protein BU16DRAFT_538424 [Lophium mytilinum]
MHTLRRAAILWLPTAAFFTIALYRILVLYRQSSLDRAYWKFPESPKLSLWIPVLFLQLYSLLQCKSQLAKVKNAMFWSLFLTSLAIRWLTLLSAFCILDFRTGPNDPADWQMLPFFSASPFKPVVFGLISEWRLWDWIYPGRYQDYSYDEASRAIRDVDGSVLYRFKPDQKPVYFSWRDLTMRLGYILVVDNFVHVIWLRYFLADGPYTAHVNNSELLTMLLVVQMAVYSYARRYTRVKFDNEVESGGTEDEKGGE